MQIAYISFGHIDVSLPLLKHLSFYKDHKIDYYILLCQKNPAESVLNFSAKSLQSKVYNVSDTQSLLPYWYKKYLNDSISTFLGIYPDTNIRSLISHLWFSEFVKLLSKKRYDILHISGVSAFLPIFYYSFRLRKTKKIATIHDIILHSGETDRIINLRKWASKKFPVIIQNKDDFNSLRGKQRRFFLPFGELDFYQYINKNESIISDFLFIGRVEEYKGIPELIEAFKLLQTEYPTIKLVIAGKGTISLKLDKSEMINIQIIDRFIENEEVAGLISSTKCVVCPYRDATQSGVLATAHAFSKVVIATEVGGFKDVIKNKVNGILVPPKNPRKLAEAMKFILVDKNRLYLEKNISSFYENDEYKWHSIAGRLLKIYSDIRK